MNSDVTICECAAIEDDWLDISYTQRHYIQDEDKALSVVRKRKTGDKKSATTWIARGLVFLLVAATLVAMSVVTEGFAGEVFALTKTTYTKNIIDVFDTVNQDKKTIVLPINVTVDNVENGTITVSGGKILLNFKAGKVVSKSDGTVTVGVDDKLQIVYGGLNTILVNVGDEIDTQAVLGKYASAATVNLIYDGEVVKDVTTVNYTLVWKI